MKQFLTFLAVAFGGLVASMSAYVKPLQEPFFGSVVQSGEYQSTSTGSQYPIPAIFNLKSEGGTIGSVIITGVNTGIIDFYDATTTNVNLRTNQKATSTLRIIQIPTSLSTGTYTFDALFANGILMVSTGTLPTSTITYR